MVVVADNDLLLLLPVLLLLLSVGDADKCTYRSAFIYLSFRPVIRLCAWYVAQYYSQDCILLMIVLPSPLLGTAYRPCGTQLYIYRYGVICGEQHIYYLGDGLEVPEGRGRRPRP
jgi:hypothetical protein